MKMVSQVDWYTVVLDGVCYADFMKVFGFDPSVLGRECLVLSNYTSIGGRPYVSIPTDYFDYQMRLEEIHLSVADVQAMGEAENVTSFQDLAMLKIDNVRVNFSGHQLQNMRIDGMDPESMILNPYYWSTKQNGGVGICRSFHPTRLDIAYDFVDHETYPDIVNRLCEELLDLRKNNVMTLVPGKGSGQSAGRAIPYQVHYDSKSCGCYLGATTSKSEFLRVYDKHLEQCQKQKVTDSVQWNANTMYRGCKSWTRIELQARDDYAVRAILMNGTPKQVIESNFLYAYEKFIKRIPHKYFPSFQNYVNLAEFAFCIIADTHTLRQQVSCMKKEKSIMQLLQYALQRAEKATLAEIARVGIDKYFEQMNDKMIKYGTSEDPVFQKKQARLNETLNAIAHSEDVPVSEFRGLKVVDDHYELKSYEELKADERKEEDLADELKQVIIEEFKFD